MWNPPLVEDAWLVLGLLVPVILTGATVLLWVELRIERWVKERRRRRGTDV